MKSDRHRPPTPLSVLPARPARRKPWGKIAVVALAIYSLLGFLVLPAVVKWQLCKQLPGLTHRMAKVEQVRMNPFALSVTVRGLALTETNGAAFVAFDELYVNFQLSSVFHRAWTFGEIRLVHPTANLIRFDDGAFNFANLASTNAATTTNLPAAPPAVLIQSLLVTNAVVTVTDFTTPQTFRAAYGPVNIALTDFNTHREKEEPYSFVATTGDGETFAWSGRFSLNQLRSQGQFKLSGIPPAKYAPYLAQFTTVQVEHGKLDLGASYRVNAARVPVELDVTNATVELRDLLVKPPESEATLLAIERFRIANASASLTGHVAQVELVELNGGSVFVSRETNGQPTVLNYLIAPPAKTGPAAVVDTNALPASMPWRFDLAEFVITNFDIALEDHSTVGIAELGLDDLALKLKGLSNQSNAPIALALAFNWRGGGALRLVTQGTFQPPDLATTVAISNLAIAPVQPYLGQYLNLTVHSGGLSVQGIAKFNPTATPRIKFKGDVGITNFSSSDTVAYHELAAWENHLVRGIDFTLHPHQLSIEEIQFIGARNNLVVSSNGQVNVAALAKLPPPTTNDPNVVLTANAAPRELFPIRVGLITLERNSFRVADDSLLRPFESRIEEISGSISNIVLPGLDKASVDIRGKVSALAPFEIVGSVTPDPKNLFVDLKVAFTNTDLTSLSPYTEKFVGRPLTKGRLTTELRYHIENKDLVAANIVDLDHLTLGGRVESPDATKLPVKLAIGLLKDMEGRIALDLPITGRTDDPQFSVWGLVGQTFKNLILKVATSPFSLLGALAGGGEELQFVDFAPGLTTLNAGQTNKLMKLAEALRKRPALEMEINATYDAVMDVDALGRRKVAERMKAMRIEELVARGKPAPALNELVLEDGEYERLMRKAYQAAFQTTPERALRDALAATLATNAPGENVVLQPASNRGEHRKGAEMLADRSKSLAQLAAAARTSGGGTNPTASASPKTERELVRDELEQRLATTAPVTSDELRSLMQQRIEVVQKILVDSAGIAAERLLSSAPNPEDINRKGAARAVFSLD